MAKGKDDAVTCIENVSIKIAGKTLVLTLDQAHDLKNVLQKLFPQPVVVERDRPYFVPGHVPPRGPWFDNVRWSAGVEKHTLICQAK